MRREAERRVRFNAEQVARLGELEEHVFDLAKERFDIDSPQALARVLFDHLKLPRVEISAQAVETPDTGPASLALAPRAVGRAPMPDPLERLRGAHLVMKLLLEYRQVEASTALLASRDLYDRIRRGEVALPVTRIQARLKRGPTPD